ncbi:hypothetical protein A3A09_02145 [Candidatus Nomurabacteria bacterium RIFCSPLOWO2_01_FULL_42_20]|uniref:Uncharacterized protein n=1 Tax=Candidatus Nomurabacteria bacterium RIFCSPHIGHO2_01_FULL_42_16 TaxID=1801743 RepID=A0A1F6VLW2_9BACT|nr:MAG: hypothetical protein A2824_01070 [Candidatus Nomurabacteria bacterium RIFCSPHIGHO2_01_FULL_42_16]OGI92084.1 MAG: hypothetical protein A3A09_02145 [Candidatus Nomurabacteria bacterium RIFCSPLOWO2_01_FULL_42_20]
MYSKEDYTYIGKFYGENDESAQARARNKNGKWLHIKLDYSPAYSERYHIASEFNFNKYEDKWLACVTTEVNRGFCKFHIDKDGIKDPAYIADMPHCHVEVNEN